MIALIVLASCDEPFVRDNPVDPGADNYQPGFSATASHLETEWVRIDWEDLPGSTGFVVERSLDGGEYEERARLDPTTLSYSDLTEQPGTYRYRVTREILGGRTVSAVTESLALGEWIRSAGSRGFPADPNEYAISMQDGRILFFRPNGSFHRSDGLIFHPGRMDWGFVLPLPLSRISSFAQLDDGRILVLGGYGGSSTVWQRVGLVVYDPKIPNWVQLREPPHPPADGYAPVALYHIEGTRVLVVFQAIGLNGHSYYPGDHGLVETVAYVFDLSTEEYREINVPENDGPFSMWITTGVVRSTNENIRVFGRTECSHLDVDYTCENETYALTFDVQDETWLRNKSTAANNLLPVSDRVYISVQDRSVALVKDDQVLVVQNVLDGTIPSYHVMEDGYVIGGRNILMVERNPLRMRAYRGPNAERTYTAVMLSSNRVMAMETSGSPTIWISRPLEQLTEIPLPSLN